MFILLHRSAVMWWHSIPPPLALALCSSFSLINTEIQLLCWQVTAHLSQLLHRVCWEKQAKAAGITRAWLALLKGERQTCEKSGVLWGGGSEVRAEEECRNEMWMRDIELRSWERELSPSPCAYRTLEPCTLYLAHSWTLNTALGPLLDPAPRTWTLHPLLGPLLIPALWFYLTITF